MFFGARVVPRGPQRLLFGSNLERIKPWWQSLHVKRNSYDKFETITAFCVYRNNIRNQPICPSQKKSQQKGFQFLSKHPSLNAKQTWSQFYYEPWIHVVQRGVTLMAGIPAEEYRYMTIFTLRSFNLISDLKQSQSFSHKILLDCKYKTTSNHSRFHSVAWAGLWESQMERRWPEWVSW